METFQLWLPGLISGFAGSGFALSRATWALGPGSALPHGTQAPPSPWGGHPSTRGGCRSPLRTGRPAVAPDDWQPRTPSQSRLFPDGTRGDETGRAFLRGCYT